MINLLEVKKTTKVEKEKVERVQASWDASLNGDKLTISATVEIDLNSKDTLDILENLKLSQSGKSYNAVATPTPKNNFVDVFSGNILLNIPKDKMFDLKELVRSKLTKKK